MKIEIIKNNPGKPAVCLIDNDIPEELTEKLSAYCTLFSISVPNWNDDLSPWPSDPVFPHGDEFGGKADIFLKQLLFQLEKKEKLLDYPVKERYLAGYSLAGLFCLYASSKTDYFQKVASVSGSLWYPGFVEYLKNHPVHAKQVYLSLGNKESKTKNPILKEAMNKTKEIGSIIGGYSGVLLTENPGNHFTDPQGRLFKGIAYLLSISDNLT